MLKYNLVSNGENQNITVVVDGEMYVADQSHRNWEAIVADAIAGDEDVIYSFDLAKPVEDAFLKISDRVSVRSGHVYFDGDLVHNVMTEHILRFLDQNLLDELDAVVSFFEKVAQNPSEHSRENLYRWLNTHDFSIDRTGDIIGYKGVYQAETGYKSSSSGRATVDGKVHVGQIPQQISSVVEMPRSEVQFDPSDGCSTGLHVGTYNYAGGYGNTMLLVRVNPRDVVSVPTDCNDAKMRVCRYFVVSEVTQQLDSPLYYTDYDEDDDDEYDVYGAGR